MKIKSNLLKLNADTRLYQLKVPIIGITGGIATGKSTVSEYLKSKNLPLIDADQIVKNIYHSDLGFEFVKTYFPSCISNQKIDFTKLRKYVFEIAENKMKVETFIFTHFEKFFMKEFDNLRNVNFIIYDVPLLFEKKLQTKIDINVLVACDEKTQVKRLIERDKISQELAQKIIKSQMPIEDKVKLAQIVINNEHDLKHLHTETEKFLNKIFDY